MHYLSRILLAIFLLVQSAESVTAQTVSPVLAIPSCANYVFPIAVSTEAGATANGPFGNLFCTSRDFAPPLLERSAAMRAFTAAIGTKPIKRLVLSSYIYSEAEFGAVICALPFSPGATIVILAQRNAQMGGRMTTDVAKALDACPMAPHYIYFGCDVFDEEGSSGVSGACPRGQVNILHFKSAHAVLEDSTSVVLVGSGNFNRSLYANIEDWLLYAGPTAHEFPTTVACAAEAIISTSGASPSAQEIGGRIAGCKSRWIKLPAVEGVRLELAPAQGPAYVERLLNALSTADEIDVAAQAFEEPQLVDAILHNTKAKIRVIADDDWYWAIRAKASKFTAHYDKIKWVGQLPDMSTRYLATNHTSLGGTGNVLHTRLVIVTQGGQRTVFTGSAHFRAGSFVDNVEHLVTITEPSLTVQYREFFDALWARALPFSRMPMIDAPIDLSKP